MNDSRRIWIAAVAVVAGVVLWRVAGGPDRAPPPPRAAAATTRDLPSPEPRTSADRPPSTGADAPAPRPVTVPPATNPGDEAAQMAKIREAVRSDAKAALAMLDAADQAHPDSAFAEERAALRVDALVGTGAIGAARDAAEAFLRLYPDSARAAHVVALTGIHPKPAGPNQR